MRICKAVATTLTLAALLFCATTMASAQDNVEIEVLEPVAFGEIDSLLKLAEDFAIRFAEDPTLVKDNMVPFVIPNRVEFLPPGADRESDEYFIDTALQTKMAPPTMLAPTPPPIFTIPGVTNAENGLMAGVSLAPPDTEGDIGLDFYFQMNNVVFDIYNKNTGLSVLPFGLPALPNNIFWSTLVGSICRTQNDGDPIVLFDHDAQRWIVSQFAVTTTGHQCFAVSQTSNPLGGYFLYDFLVTPGPAGLNDYPKGGVWSDAYYFSFNEFQGAGFTGAVAAAFEKAQMIVGNPAAQGVRATLPFTGVAPIHFSLQPSHWEGMNAPLPRQPNTFIQAFDDQTWGTGAGPDGYFLWDFSVDWTNPLASTFTQLPFLPTTSAFNANLCGFAPCVPQPGTATLLDTLGQFTMYRLQWRNFSTYDTLVANHTVNVGANRAGVRWVELRDTGTGWNLFQTGSFAPGSTIHRWMGSAAMDSSGNIALGYSASSTSLRPEVRYTSRMAIDPPGTMPGGEITCRAGAGVQTSPNRWGDYSTISVDPVDDCTFWYTNEYYDTNIGFDWETEICKFSFPNTDCHKQFCGNSVLDIGELCDAIDFGTQTCTSFGFDIGFLGCNSRCNQISTANCCRVGNGNGSWNLPAGPSQGTMLGSLVRAGIPTYQILATLTGTAASGALNGTLADGVAPDPDYTVSGIYAATGPNSGTFNARVIDSNGNVVGIIIGTWNDQPGLPSVGTFTITNWTICGP